MADLRIVDAPLLSTVKGTEKIPTGGEGNFSVSVNQVADFAKLKWVLATEGYVDNAVGNVQSDLNLHKNNKANPHNVTKTQVGLGNVDNTADLDKPVSNATQSAISTANSGKADKSYVDFQDQLKADKLYVDSQLVLKANEVDVDSSLLTKADKTYVDDQLTLKSDKTYVDAALVSKADKTYVDSQDLALQTQINQKATAEYLDNALTEQTQTVNTALSNLSTVANKFYPILAEANADIANIAVNQVVNIGEVDNGGLWYKATVGATSLTKSPYDPITQAKAYTDAIKLLLDSDVSKNRDSITRLLVSMEAFVLALNTESTDLNSKINAVKTDINNILASNLQLSTTLTQHLTAIQILVKTIEDQSDEIQKNKDYIKDQIVANHILVSDLSKQPNQTKNLELKSKSVSIQTEVPRENIPSWMSNDGLKMWSFYNDKLLESADFGETWYVIYSFTTSDRVEWVRQLDNGELLMQTITFIYDGQGQLSQRLERIQRTIGYKSGTFTIAPCFSFENPWVYAAYGWSVSEYKNIVLVFEYGAKANEAFGSGYVAPVGMNARYLRLSLDYGVTWKVIFDLNDYAVTDKVHGHGVCYDPYWQRIWLTYGDGSNATMYSDDLGETWIFAHHITVYEGEHQNVGIVALPDCILFGTDYHPDGIQRIDRKHGKHTAGGTYPIDSAYFINIGQTQRKYVCMSIFKSKHQPINPVLFGFCPETGDAYSCIIGTYDGFNFFNVWTDTLLQPTGKGLQTVVGVTPINEIIVKISDTRTSGTAKLTKITLKV